MVAALLPAAGVNGASGGRKDVLPDELPGRVGALSLQGVGQIDLAASGGQVLLVEQAHPFDLAAQFGDDGLQRGYPGVNHEQPGGGQRHLRRREFAGGHHRAKPGRQNHLLAQRRPGPIDDAERHVRRRRVVLS